MTARKGRHGGANPGADFVAAVHGAGRVLDVLDIRRVVLDPDVPIPAFSGPGNCLLEVVESRRQLLAAEQRIGHPSTSRVWVGGVLCRRRRRKIVCRLTSGGGAD